MKHAFAYGAVAIALAGCDAQETTPQAPRKAEEILLIECTMAGNSVMKDRRGSEATPVASTTYYRVDPISNDLKIYNPKTEKYMSACPPDRKCEISVTRAAISILSSHSNADGIVMTGRTNIDRISGTATDYQQIQWLLDGRSVMSNETGHCQRTVQPAPKF